MNRLSVRVADYCGSAGSGVEEVNAIFDFIELNYNARLDYLEFNFEDVRVISTKFSGRFLERVSRLRRKRPDLKVRIENANRGVESAFDYQKKLKNK